MTSPTTDRGDWQSRWQELVKGIVRVQSMRGEQQLLAWLTRSGEPRILAFVNAHAMNAAAVSMKFFNALISADLLLRDGIGMAILLRLLNQPPGLNLNGTDLIPKILRQFGGRTIALFGTQDPYLASARAAVSTRIAPGAYCIIVLGMGMPRQEEVAVALRAAVGFPCLIICGGAIIDFLGNKTSRAPLWMRRAGFEWLFRLGLEPRRLFRRYVIGNPLFMARALRLAARTLRREH